MSYHRNVGSTSPRRTTQIPSSVRSNSRPRSSSYYSGSTNGYNSGAGNYNSGAGNYSSGTGNYSSGAGNYSSGSGSYNSGPSYNSNPYSHGANASHGGNSYSHGGYSSNPYSSHGGSNYYPSTSYGNYGNSYSTYGGTNSGYGSLHLPSTSSLSGSPSGSSYLSSSPSSSFKHLTPGGYSKSAASRVASRLSPSRSGMGSRSGSTSSLAGLSTKSEGSEGYASEDRSGRSSRLSSVSSTGGVSEDSPRPNPGTTENGEIDYKKLYEESQAQNERLREKLKKTEDELLETRNTVEKHVNMNKSTLSEIEKRERRALERKLSEMEEELKQLQKLKAENERLKAENRALTRVVSKLTNSAHK